MTAFLNACVAGVNDVGRGFCTHAAGMFVQSGVLIVVLLLVDLVLRKRVRATLRYWIWMLVFVKLLLPPSLSLPTGIGYWVGGYATRPASMSPPAPQMEETHAPVMASPQPEVTVPTGVPPAQTVAAEIRPVTREPVESIAVRGERLTWQGGVFLLWGVGVLVLTARVTQRLYFVRRLIAQAEPAQGPWLDLLDQCCGRVGVCRRIGMKASIRSFSPAVCGLWRPTILMPASLLTESSACNVRVVLIHELAHVKRADLSVNCLQTALQIIYFYNPLVWLANAIVRHVREQAVDEMVLVALGAEAGSYGPALIDIAEMTFRRAGPALCLVSVAESKKSLEGRIKHMIARPVPKSARLGLAGCVAVIATAAVLLPMAQAQNAPSPPAADVSNGEATLPLESRAPVKEGEDEAEAIRKAADAYCQQRKYAEACGLYRHLLDKYPGADGTQTARGSLVLAAALLGDEGPTQAAIEGLLISRPQDERLLRQVLDVAEKLRLRFQYDPARRLFQYIIETWPQTQEAASSRMCLVDIEVEPLVPAQNKAVLQQTIEKLVSQCQGNPYLPRTVDRIGDLCAFGKRYAEAEAIYRRVITLAGEDAERAADAQMAIAWLYFEQGWYDEALHEYAIVVQDYPNTKSAAGGQYWLGQCYLRKGDLAQAAKEYRKTVELYPGDIYAGHAEKQLALVDRRKKMEVARAQRREPLQRTTNQRSPQAPGTERGQSVRQASESVAPAGAIVFPGPVPSDYESKVAGVLQRYALAVEKAYRDVGLTGQDVERFLFEQKGPGTAEMKAYQQTWPALNEARQTAIEELAALGPDAVPVLLRGTDTSGDRRGGDLFASAIRMIGASAVPGAIEGLASPDRKVRMRAANSLCEIRDQRAAEPLMRALADPDRGVLIAVVGALGVLADPEASDALLALWNKGDTVIRPQVAWALGTLGDRRAVEPILGALQECLSSAKTTGSWDADGWRMKRYVDALGQLRDARAIPLLKELLPAGPETAEKDRGVYTVAEAAAGALRRLGCQVTGDRDKGYRVAEDSPPRQALHQARDYEAATTVPQPIAQWLTQDYGCGGNPRSWQAMQRDGKRSYPITLVWPRIREAAKYVVHVKGLRGSRPARSYEAATNSLRLGRVDLAPGRYQWSVSVYDAQGTFLGEVETIDPVEVFAVADPQPAQANGKRVLIDLNHSTGNIAGWGWNNHGQYMTKELLEDAGFAVDVNVRDLLTAERLRTVDLLICHYYWTGWPDFRPYLESELAAVRQFVQRGGSLLVVGCDGTDGRGKMTRAGNQLVQEFGLRFWWDEATPEDGWAQVLPQQNILSADRRIQVQLPVGVEGDGSTPLLQFQGVPIARAKSFGNGKIVVAGVGMSFLDCYLGDFEYREPVHIIMFYDFIEYLTGIEWRQACEKELLQTLLSRARVVGTPR
jgi:beta-lactamase regulating signal transducer with metallopeptidase domain/TolA-binding protein